MIPRVLMFAVINALGGFENHFDYTDRHVEVIRLNSYNNKNKIKYKIKHNKYYYSISRQLLRFTLTLLGVGISIIKIVKKETIALVLV